MATGLLGPSAAQPPLPSRGPHPPFWFATFPAPELVTALLLTALLLAAVGLALGMRALATGWDPQPRRLLGFGLLAVVAMVAVPPMGSADHLVYAAYGRLVTTGGNPYTDSAATLAARGDPVGQAVEAPWQDTPSVYGPIGTAEQALAAWLGGDSPHAVVMWLQVLNAMAYLLTGLLLQRLAGSRAGQARAALLWSLNPLLLYAVVNAAHIDGFGVAFAVAALAALRRSPLAAGALAGAACAVKLSFGLYVLALLWAVRRDRRALAAVLGAGAVVGAVAYAPVGLDALGQAREAARFVSFATAPRLLVGPLEAVLDDDRARSLIGLLGWVGLAALTWLLARAVPLRPGADRVAEATRAAGLLGVAWLLTAPYSLPWYDVAAWAPVALLAPSVVDGFLLARSTAMAAAYVPGRVVDLPDALDTFARTLRGTVTPVLMLGLLGLLVLRCRSTTAPRTPPPRAAPRRSGPPPG